VLRFLVGNKCDLDSKRKVTYEQGKELARQYNIQFLETSAKDTVNIDELFQSTTKTFLEKQSTVVKKDKTPKALKASDTISVEAVGNKDKKKKGCC
jgi:Ras-related protein Rab-1A